MIDSDDLLDPSVKQGAGNVGYNGDRLPNANATLVLGIISIVGCILYGVPGLVCGIIALVIHKKDKEMYKSDPGRYALSYKNAKAGYICAIIGISISALYFVVLLVAVVFAFSSVTRF